jgi:hypothetical protein
MNIAVVSQSQSQSLSYQHMAALSPPLLVRQKMYSVLLLSPNHTSMVPTINQQSLLHPHLASHNRHKSKWNNYIVVHQGEVEGCAAGDFQAYIETTSWAIPTSRPSSPNKADKNRPRIATVKAFLSEVCLSSHAIILLAGGGCDIISRISVNRSPQ